MFPLMAIIKAQPAGSSTCCTLYFEFTNSHYKGVGYWFCVASWFALFVCFLIQGSLRIQTKIRKNSSFIDHGDTAQ